MRAKKSNQPWTIKEIMFLKDNYEKMDARDIAKKLSRSRNSIYGQASILGLRKPKKEYAVYEYGKLVATGTIEELSKRLGKKEHTLRVYATPKGRTENFRVERLG